MIVPSFSFLAFTIYIIAIWYVVDFALYFDWRKVTQLVIQLIYLLFNSSKIRFYEGVGLVERLA